jgi:hypothetical protein
MLDEKWPLGYVQVYGDAVVDRDAELAAGVLNQVLGLMAGEPVPPKRWPQVKEMARREHRVVIRVRPYATFATPPRMFTILCTQQRPCLASGNTSRSAAQNPGAPSPWASFL